MGEAQKPITSKYILGKYVMRLFSLLFYILYNIGCSSPSPKDEVVRIPKILEGSQYGEENRLLSIDLLISIPDPEFKTDKLNPEKYEAGNLEFACVANCPDGMTVDAVTGKVDWTPNNDQAGIYYITFSAISGVFSSETSNPVIIRDVDRAADPPPEGFVVAAVENELLEYQIELPDPDGDAVVIECIKNCPPGITIDDSGKISWTPTFEDGGETFAVFAAKSRPSSRDFVIQGLENPDDIEMAKKALDHDIINREFEQIREFAILFQVSESDRPPQLKDVNHIVIQEMELLEFTLEIDDPDQDVLSFICDAKCPEGLSIGQTTGEVYGCRPTNSRETMLSLWTSEKERSRRVHTQLR